MKIEDVARPTVAEGTLLVETKAPIVSAGTEKMIVELAKRSNNNSLMKRRNV